MDHQPTAVLSSGHRVCRSLMGFRTSNHAGSEIRQYGLVSRGSGARFGLSQPVIDPSGGVTHHFHRVAELTSRVCGNDPVTEIRQEEVMAVKGIFEPPCHHIHYPLSTMTTSITDSEVVGRGLDGSGAAVTTVASLVLVPTIFKLHYCSTSNGIDLIQVEAGRFQCVLSMSSRFRRCLRLILCYALSFSSPPLH
ncbi:hypothetical protein OG21DRAFT_839315 [Imleria badia]|nr:hypothetical protein OG21DRAFT_839315 [Imleria badia]